MADANILEELEEEMEELKNKKLEEENKKLEEKDKKLEEMAEKTKEVMEKNHKLVKENAELAEKNMEAKAVVEKMEEVVENHNKLVAELRAKVECPVCLVLPTEGPMASCPNGHLVCLLCHQSMATQGLVNCPNCREAMGNTMSLLAKTVIENIEHECKNEGCKKMLPHKEVVRHKEEFCDYRKVPCTLGCNQMLPHKEMLNHKEELCDYRKVLCELGCNQGIPHNELIKHKEEICDYRIVLCPEPLCKLKMYHRVLVKHMKEICDYRKALCPELGCNKTMPYKEVVRHKEEVCRYRKVLCPEQGCKQLMPLKALAKHKREVCTERKVLCPGNSCFCSKSTMPLSELNNHLKICTSVNATNQGSSCTLLIRKNVFGDGDIVNLRTEIFNINNEVFAVQKTSHYNNFSFGVLMLAEEEKCNRFKVTIAIEDGNSETAFLAQFSPSPIDKKNLDIASLVVQKRMFSKMVKTGGDQIKYKLVMKVSEKREIAQGDGK